MKHQGGLFRFPKFLLVIFYETLIKLHLCSPWHPKPVEVNHLLCKGTNTLQTLLQERWRKLKTKCYFLPPSWYPFHVANDLRFWYFQGSCQGLWKRKNIDFVGIISGRNLQWNRHTREQIFNKSGINYVAGLGVLKFTEQPCRQFKWPEGPYQKYNKQPKEDVSDLLGGFCISLSACWGDPSQQRWLQTHGSDSRRGRGVWGRPSCGSQVSWEAPSSFLAPTGFPRTRW